MLYSALSTDNVLFIRVDESKQVSDTLTTILNLVSIAPFTERNKGHGNHDSMSEIHNLLIFK